MSPVQFGLQKTVGVIAMAVVVAVAVARKEQGQKCHALLAAA